MWFPFTAINENDIELNADLTDNLLKKPTKTLLKTKLFNKTVNWQKVKNVPAFSVKVNLLVRPIVTLSVLGN